MGTYCAPHARIQAFLSEGGGGSRSNYQKGVLTTFFKSSSYFAAYSGGGGGGIEWFIDGFLSEKTLTFQDFSGVHHFPGAI